MKRIVALIAVIFFTIAISGCGADEKRLSDGHVYNTYGVLNSDSQRNPNVRYEVSPWSIFWGIVFVETIIAPIYFFGFDLYEPVGFVTDSPDDKGIVK